VQYKYAGVPSFEHAITGGFVRASLFLQQVSLNARKIRYSRTFGS